MAAPKGKRRNRSKRRTLGGSDSADRPVATVSSPEQKRSSRPIMRRGRPAPLWANLLFGLGLPIYSLIFFVTGPSGKDSTVRIFLVILSCAMAVFYLRRALRQIQERRKT